MPGLALGVAGVGSDCLAVVLFALLKWAGLRAVQTGLSSARATNRPGERGACHRARAVYAAVPVAAAGVQGGQRPLAGASAHLW